MMYQTVKILFLLFNFNIITVFTIWPPPYKVNLSYFEEFIIGDENNNNNNDEFINNNNNNNNNNNDDEDDINDEMVKNFDLNLEFNKFQRLHQLVKKYNDESDESERFLNKKKYLFDDNKNYDDLIEDEPFEAGFLQPQVKFSTEEKREDPIKNADYNYDTLNSEYQDLIRKEEKLNSTFNSTSYDENETVKDAFGKMFDFTSTPRNCTAEELQGIGFGAVKCVWIEINKTERTESGTELFRRIRRLVTIWILIYLAVVLPFWCQKGWCFCCFQCKICKPTEQIQEAKKYYMDNPPGIFMNANTNEIIRFQPTIYEINAYEKLQATLMTI